MKKSYHIKEAAEEFAVSRSTVERAIKRGEIQSYKIGDARRIAAEEIDRLKKKDSVKSA